MAPDTPYYREILILQSTLTKLAAQNPDEDINQIIELAHKIAHRGLRSYFTNQEKQKIQNAITCLKEQEHLELSHIQDDLTQMLNNDTSAEKFFERRFTIPKRPFENIDTYIESKFNNPSQITNTEVRNIAQEPKNTPIEFNDKDFTDIFLENIKLLFGKSRYRENNGEYQYRDITFYRCTFHNLNLSNMHFKSNVSFKECLFTGNTDFRNSVFENDVSFKGSHFNGTTHFEDTNFLKNAHFEHIKTFGYAFLFNQYTLDISKNDDWFRYVWSFRGAQFNSKAAFFRRVFPERVNFSYITFNNTFYFTDCKFPLKIEAGYFDFSPQKIPDFEISIRTLIAALEQCYCTRAKNELQVWEQKARELSTQTIIDDEKGELLSPRATAAILGYSEASLRTMRSQFPDKIKFVKRGNRVFYYKSSIDEFLKLIPSKKKQVI